MIQPVTGTGLSQAFGDTAGGVCTSCSGIPLLSGRRSRIFHGVSHLISFRPLHEDETNCVPEMPTSPLFPETANSAVNVCFSCLLPICSQTQMLSKKIGIFLSLSLSFPLFKNHFSSTVAWKISGSPVGFQPMKLMGLTLCLFPLPVVLWEPQIQVTSCHLVAWHSLKKQVT